MSVEARNRDKRAWKTTWNGIESIVSATSRGKALAVTLDEALDAGYRVRFPDIRCVRAPEFDGWAEQDYSGQGWFAKDLPKGA